MQGVQVKLCYPLTMRAIPERLKDVSCGGAIQIDYFHAPPLLLLDSDQLNGSVKEPNMFHN